MVLPAARAVHAATSLPVSFLIAQWAHETGWGESRAAQLDHNWAGLKPWWGNSYPGVTGYNHYTDLDDWARGYADFVQRNDLYAPALAAAREGRSTFEVADLMGPWVGEPGKIDELTGTVITTGYGAAIARLILDNGLTSYDLLMAALDPADVKAAIHAPGGYAAELEDLELGPLKAAIQELTKRISDLELRTDGEARALLAQIGDVLAATFKTPPPA